jgi:hypothetical protein
MERIRLEAKLLFAPEARCFKGMSILFIIWAMASILISGFVTSLIYVNVRNMPDTVVEQRLISVNETTLNYL